VKVLDPKRGRSIPQLIRVFANAEVSAMAIRHQCPTCSEPAGKVCVGFSNIVDQIFADHGKWAHGKRKALVSHAESIPAILAGIDRMEAGGELTESGKARIPLDRAFLARMSAKGGAS